MNKIRPLDDFALVVVDAQNAFLANDGSFVRRGFKLERNHEIKQSILDLVRVFRELGRPTICTKIEFSPDYSDAGLLVHQKHPVIREFSAYVRGNRDTELFPELKLESEGWAHILVKKRYDAFLEETFVSLVQKLNIRQFVVCGVLTNVCVESFVRSAFDRDYPVTVIKEATGTYSSDLHSASLQTLQAHYAEVVSLSCFHQSIANIKQFQSTK